MKLGTVKGLVQSHTARDLNLDGPTSEPVYVTILLIASKEKSSLKVINGSKATSCAKDVELAVVVSQGRGTQEKAH